MFETSCECAGWRYLHCGTCAGRGLEEPRHYGDSGAQGIQGFWMTRRNVALSGDAYVIFVNKEGTEVTTTGAETGGQNLPDTIRRRRSAWVDGDQITNTWRHSWLLLCMLATAPQHQTHGMVEHAVSGDGTRCWCTACCCNFCPPPDKSGYLHTSEIHVSPEGYGELLSCRDGCLQLTRDQPSTHAFRTQRYA
jgi:hypothetical protein